MSVLTPRNVIATPEPDDILVDYMGLPLSRKEVEAVLVKARKHLKKSPASIAAYGNEVIKNQYPTMVDQVHFEPEDFK